MRQSIDPYTGRRINHVQNRRAFALIAFLTALAATAASAQDKPPAQPPRYNVVIYLIDGVRADHVGAYGYDKPTSPVLDALAEKSVVFEQCSAPAPWSLPSVASVHTAKLSCDHGELHENEELALNQPRLAPRARKAGFSTASFFTNPYSGPSIGLQKGFDEWAGMEVLDPGRVAAWLSAPSDKPRLLVLHDGNMRELADVDEQFVKPFGSVKAALRKQLPKLVNQYRQTLNSDFLNGKTRGSSKTFGKLRAYLRQFDEMKPRINTLYDASLRETDHTVGLMIDALRKANLWDSTVFVLAGTHGVALGEHDLWWEGQSVYDELIHVPLIVHFPSDRDAGTRITTPVSLVDIVPTVAEATGADALKLDGAGRSLIPLLHADTEAQEEPMRVTSLRLNMRSWYRRSMRARGDHNVVVRDGMYKAIWNVQLDTVELYDLRSDPGEEHDLHETETQRAEAMRAFARTSVLDSIVRVTGTQSALLKSLDPETRRILREAGVIQKNHKRGKKRKKP